MSPINAYRNSERYHTYSKPGFTLFEIIIAIAIFSALVAFLYPQIIKMQQNAKIGQAKQALATIKNAIEIYHTDVDEYPTKLEDLVKRPSVEPAQSKWSTGGYLAKEKVPNDPWGKKFVYKLNSPDTEPPYELYSYGPNGQKAPKVEWIRA
jgi:type II secretion system protein G